MSIRSSWSQLANTWGKWLMPNWDSGNIKNMHVRKQLMPPRNLQNCYPKLAGRNIVGDCCFLRHMWKQRHLQTFGKGSRWFQGAIITTSDGAVLVVTAMIPTTFWPKNWMCCAMENVWRDTQEGGIPQSQSLLILDNTSGMILWRVAGCTGSFLTLANSLNENTGRPIILLTSFLLDTVV